MCGGGGDDEVDPVEEYEGPTQFERDLLDTSVQLFNKAQGIEYDGISTARGKVNLNTSASERFNSAGRAAIEARIAAGGGAPYAQVGSGRGLGAAVDRLTMAQRAANEAVAGSVAAGTVAKVNAASRISGGGGVSGGTLDTAGIRAAAGFASSQNSIANNIVSTQNTVSDARADHNATVAGAQLGFAQAGLNAYGRHIARTTGTTDIGYMVP